MSSELKRILRRKHRDVSRLPTIDEKSLRPSDRDFIGAVRVPQRSIIAEMKPASPSSGVLAAHYDPTTRAACYERGGASALSVLTDERFFQGSPSHLVEARLASRLPVLRKDFIIDVRQIAQSRFMGADACLLIAAALDARQMAELHTRAQDLGMDVVVEVHSAQELDAALEIGARIIGINNRNLHDLSIDLDTTTRLCPLVPDDVLVVSASGIRDPLAVRALPPRVDAVLIGTALMKSHDPEAFLREALGVERTRA